MTKFALLAAASTAAIVFAGAAQAGSITSATVNGVTIDPANSTAASRTFYTVASERVNAAHNTGAGGFTVVTGLAVKPTIAVAAPAQSFEVTYTVAGGTIPTSAVATLTVQQTVGVGGTAGTVAIVQGARSATSITFIVTVNAPTVANATVDGFTLVTQLNDDAVEGDITIGANTNILAGGVSSLIDTVAPTTVVRYRSALGAYSISAKNALAALPDFKAFKAGAAPVATITDLLPGSTTNGRTAEIATDLTRTVDTTGVAGGIRASLSGAAVTLTDLLGAGTLTVSGNLPTGLNVVLNDLPTIAAAPTRTTSSLTYSLTAAESAAVAAANIDLRLQQPTAAGDRVALSSGSYTLGLSFAGGTGYEAPAAISLAAGNVALDGVNFIAPWIGGPQAPGQTVVRLSNGGSAASGAVTLRLINAQARAAGVTSGPGETIANQVCSTSFTVPATGELQITGATLATCFGQFLRGDLQITVQSDSSNLTAKARNVSADGSVFEQTLGRFSGNDASGAQF